MLRSLTISNFALIDNLKMDFGAGLNVITGETGAGKSILVGAIAIVLGGRANSDLTINEDARLELYFSDEYRSTRLRRMIKLNGTTKAWVDGSPSTITSLRAEAKKWVDLTAQREGATLLDSDTHLIHLDRLAGLTGDSSKLEVLYAEWLSLKARLAALDANIKRLKETEELARFQLDEIERFNPQQNENESLDKEIRLLEGAESLIVGLNEIVDILEQGNESVTDRIAVIRSSLSALTEIDNSLAESSSWIDEALDLIREAVRDFSERKDSTQLDPEKLEDLRERRGQLSRLIRKYGGSMGMLLQTYNDLMQRESGGQSLLKERKQMIEDLNRHLADWERLLRKVSDKRKRKKTSIEKTMLSALKTVGIEKPRFEITWLEESGDKVDFPVTGEHLVNSSGWDRIVFRISFNPGYPLKPLHHVASGGELSRVMLLLKSLHPPEETPPTLIFDEIDTGISGRTARQVGLRLKELSKNRQVLVVTHLPQIASLADLHLVVEKETRNSTTKVNFRNIPIGGKEQIEEIARLSGGEEITDAIRVSAKELIDNQ